MRLRGYGAKSDPEYRADEVPTTLSSMKSRAYISYEYPKMVNTLRVLKKTTRPARQKAEKKKKWELIMATTYERSITKKLITMRNTGIHMLSRGNKIQIERQGNKKVSPTGKNKIGIKTVTRVATSECTQSAFVWALKGNEKCLAM